MAYTTPRRFADAALIALIALAIVVPGIARAEDTIKVGVLVEMSGPHASYGQQITSGMKAFLRERGDRVAGKKIELYIRDTTGPAPDLAKRLAQELVTREKVHFLAGFGLTPHALAVAPVATQARTPMVVMNAATSAITTRSPYIVRVSFTIPQISAPMARWAARNGITQVYTLVTDYAPGLDAESTFSRVFTAAGGKVVGSARVPLASPEFAPFIQRIKDSRPQAVFVFVPAGQPAVGFMKAFSDRGLRRAGIRLIGTGDVTGDDVIEALGDSALEVITTHHYSAAHASPENELFKKAFAQVAGTQVRANFMAVGGWDGMHLIHEVCKKLDGKIDGDRAMQVVKGLTLQSPRGSITIDPDTRDVIQDVYVRKVQKIDGRPFNVEFDRERAVKDPGKSGPGRT
jgi:branched-chain amino acid transport system substrate-binding protein